MGRILLAGAGHAHMAVMEATADLVARGHALTAIGPGDRHYYSGMGPGMLGGTYQPEEISFPVRAMVESRGGVFIQGRVMAIDAARHVVVLESGREVAYDVVSCNLGSQVPQEVVDGSAKSGTRHRVKDVFPVKPIEQLLEARKRILELARHGRVRIGVCGGGPAALEVAGNAWAASHAQGGKGSTVQIFCGSELLKNMPTKVRRMARKTLKNRGIEVISGSYVQSVESGMIQLQNGQRHAQDVIILALGVRPPAVFRKSGLGTGPDGGLVVNQFLQSADHPDIFGGGDCIHFQPRPLDKVGVYAVRQSPVLLHNLQARLARQTLQAFDPGGNYLLIFNLGAHQGILHRNRIAFGGRLAFWIKDSIDRKFIRTYQPK